MLEVERLEGLIQFAPDKRELRNIQRQIDNLTRSEISKELEKDKSEMNDRLNKHRITALLGGKTRKRIPRVPRKANLNNG